MDSCIFYSNRWPIHSYTSQKMAAGILEKNKLLAGIVAIIGSVLLFFHAYRFATYAKKDAYDEHKNIWHTTYESALEQARSENKKMFIDFWATFCPICLAINKTVLTKPAIIETLQQNYVSSKS